MILRADGPARTVRPIVRGGAWEGQREMLEGVKTPGAADCPKGAPKVLPRNAASAIRVEHAAAIHCGKHWARNSPGMLPAKLLLGDAELPYRDAHVGAAAHEQPEHDQNKPNGVDACE